MPQNLLACHGVLGFVCAVGESGQIIHFEGDVYRAKEVQSPTTDTLRAVWVESPWSAWACGDAGTVLRWDGSRASARGASTSWPRSWSGTARRSKWRSPCRQPRRSPGPLPGAI